MSFQSKISEVLPTKKYHISIIRCQVTDDDVLYKFFFSILISRVQFIPELVDITFLFHLFSTEVQYQSWYLTDQFFLFYKSIHYAMFRFDKNECCTFEISKNFVFYISFHEKNNKLSGLEVTLSGKNFNLKN